MTTVPVKINPKETYMLIDNGRERNFIICDCCSPVPGDDVMGFVNTADKVEVHALDCPRAAALKATYGPRIIATKWQDVSASFRATIHMEGIDRRGILQEITGVISKIAHVDIRGLSIEASNEVFTGDLTVLTTDTSAIEDITSRLLKVKGIMSAVRVNS